MVKIGRERTKLHAARPAKSSSTGKSKDPVGGGAVHDDVGTADGDVITGHRKRQYGRRLNQLRALDFAGVTLSEKKRRRQKSSQALDHIGSLASELDGIQAKVVSDGVHMGMKLGNGKVLTKKRRARVMREESAQFRAVITNPLFQQNPLAAITEHLSSVIKSGLVASAEVTPSSRMPRKARNVTNKHHPS